MDESVEAYWVGNQVLERVNVSLLGASLDDRFRSRVGRQWQYLVEAVPAGALPRHSFHVLGVYPRVGQLAGRDGQRAAARTRPMPDR